jgi:hypothetical protein
MSLDPISILIGIILLFVAILAIKIAKCLGKIIGLVILFILIMVYIVPNIPI